MTNEEIRKLDVWIAQHVMGWKIHSRNTAHYVDADKVNSTDYVFRAAYNWSAINTPDAAMLVLEKCAEVTNPKIAKSVDGCIMWVVSSQDFGKAVVVEAETLPLAICLFAKKLFS